MKKGMEAILGKTITGIIVYSRPETCNPYTQVLLFFSDGTGTEFYSVKDMTTGIGGIRTDQRIEHWRSGDGRIILDAELDQNGKPVVNKFKNT